MHTDPSQAVVILNSISSVGSAPVLQADVDSKPLGLSVREPAILPEKVVHSSSTLSSPHTRAC